MSWPRRTTAALSDCPGHSQAACRTPSSQASAPSAPMSPSPLTILLRNTAFMERWRDLSRLDGSLSLVIPVHNEAPNMTTVIGKSITVLDGLAPDWEIVLVNGGSTDDTVTVARVAMGSAASRLRVLSHDSKRGYGITVADGLRASRMAYVAFMDGDGQFDPADLRALADLMSSADLAAGWRRHRADPRYRLAVAGALNLLGGTLYRVRVRDIDCGLKLMRRDGLEAAAPLLARSGLDRESVV